MTSRSNRVPNLQPVELFAGDAQEAFNRYLRNTPHRFRFDDKRYDQYTTWLAGRESDATESALSRNEQKTRSRVLQRFYLNVDKKLCYHDTTSQQELQVLRDWQLFGAITSTHCEIPHGGQEKTFNIVSEKFYGIIRPEV